MNEITVENKDVMRVMILSFLLGTIFFMLSTVSFFLSRGLTSVTINIVPFTIGSMFHIITFVIISAALAFDTKIFNLNPSKILVKLLIYYQRKGRTLYLIFAFVLFSWISVLLSYGSFRLAENFSHTQLFDEFTIDFGNSFLINIVLVAIFAFCLSFTIEWLNENLRFIYTGRVR